MESLMTYKWTEPGQYTFAKDRHQVEFWSEPQTNDEKPRFFGRIVFQDGPIVEHGVNGTQNEEVLEAIIDRLQELNKPPYACRENSLAITHLQEGLFWLRERTRARSARGVEGTSTA